MLGLPFCHFLRLQFTAAGWLSSLLSLCHRRLRLIFSPFRKVSWTIACNVLVQVSTVDAHNCYWCRHCFYRHTIYLLRLSHTYTLHEHTNMHRHTHTRTQYSVLPLPFWLNRIIFIIDFGSDFFLFFNFVAALFSLSFLAVLSLFCGCVRMCVHCSSYSGRKVLYARSYFLPVLLSALMYQ